MVWATTASGSWCIDEKATVTYRHSLNPIPLLRTFNVSLLNAAMMWSDVVGEGRPGNSFERYLFLVSGSWRLWSKGVFEWPEDNKINDTCRPCTLGDELVVDLQFLILTSWLSISNKYVEEAVVSHPRSTSETREPGDRGKKQKSGNCTDWTQNNKMKGTKKRELYWLDPKKW